MIICKFCRRQYPDKKAGSICEGCGALLDVQVASTISAQPPELIVIQTPPKNAPKKETTPKEKTFLFRVGVIWGLLCSLGLIANLIIWHPGNVVFFLLSTFLCGMIIKKRSHLLHTKNFRSSLVWGSFFSFISATSFSAANPTSGTDILAMISFLLLLTSLILLFIYRIKS